MTRRRDSHGDRSGPFAQQPGITRRNHFASQFYLRGWTTSDAHGERLWSHHIAQSGRAYSSREPTSAVGYGWNTLTLEADPAAGRSAPSDEYEKKFTHEIDTPAAGVLRRLVAFSRDISGRDKEVMLRFLVSVAARNPAIGPSEREREAGIEELAAKVAQERGVSIEVARAAFGQLDWREIAIQARLQSAVTADGFRHLLNEPWVGVPRGAHVPEVFTSDLPAVYSEVSGRPRVDWLVMGLSPDALLVLGFPPQGLNENGALLRWYNEQMVARARLFPGSRLFTRSDVKPLA